MFTVENTFKLVFPMLGKIQQSGEYKYTMASIGDTGDKYYVLANELRDGELICTETLNLRCNFTTCDNFMHLLYDNRVSPAHVRDIAHDLGLEIFY